MKIISLGLEPLVGVYKDNCDLCGKELNYSAKYNCIFEDGNEKILVICKECRDKLIPELEKKCELCRHFEKSKRFDNMGWCKLFTNFTAKWNSCRYFEGDRNDRCK